MVDVVALQKALEVTQERAEKGMHVQASWLGYEECGTTGCFAGNWALHRGCVPVWDTAPWHTDPVPPEPGDDTYLILTPRGERAKVDEWVKQDLGLSNRQALALFDGEITLAELEEIVGLIVDGQL